MIQGIVAQDTAVAVGPPAGYSAHAVHFAGSSQSLGPTYLSRSSLSCTNNGFFSFSYWLKNPLYNNAGSIVWVVDPNGNYGNYHSIQTVSATPGYHKYEFEDLTHQFVARYVPLSSAWHHILGSAEMNHAAGSKVLAVYVDDVLQTYNLKTDGGISFSPLFNGLQFVFGDDTFNDGLTMDVCDVWIAPGVSLLGGGSTIPEITRRQFTDFDTGIGCIPIDPTTFPSSAILFTGGPSTFATNLGTGGSFTLTGTLTNASTNPP